VLGSELDERILGEMLVVSIIVVRRRRGRDDTRESLRRGAL